MANCQNAMNNQCGTDLINCQANVIPTPEDLADSMIWAHTIVSKNACKKANKMLKNQVNSKCVNEKGVPTDCLGVIDAPRLTAGTVKGTPEELVSIMESTGVDSSYACTFWPWIQIDDVNNAEFTWQPPTLMAVEAMALTDNVANPWFAPAGLNRGKANSTIQKADIRLTQRNRDVLYEGRINPIATFIQQGVVIWGQKTLQVRQSSLDRINIRRLLLQVRRLVAAASLTLLFEQNDQTLRDQFLSKVEPILLQIQTQRGLTAFNVVMDSSNNNDETIDRNTLVGKIQLKPTRVAEFIDLTFQVLPTGANFEDF